MPKELHPERFHALDATRAFALLLGVVFHAAWYYAPWPVGTAVQDEEANHLLGWFFFASHTFRMQVFFLIAGFFARLVYHRRGFPAFARNRLIRIAIPLVVGWMILFPLTSMVWIWGYNLTIPDSVPVAPYLAVLYVIVSGLIFQPKPLGGSFSLAHLWFLYYLLQFYVVVLVGYGLVTRSEGLTRRLQAMADRALLFLAGSPWGVLVLAGLLTPIMWGMKTWSGMDTPTESLSPSLMVLLAYGTFFVFGWVLHRQAHRLSLLFRPWALYLALGGMGSVGLYMVYMKVGAFDVILPPQVVLHRNVTDWSQFQASLLATPGDGDRPSPAYLLRDALSESLVRFLETKPALNHAQQARVLDEVSKALRDPDLLRPDRVRPWPPGLGDPAAFSANRAALQPYWRGVEEGDARTESWYKPAKLAFAAGYSLVMVWLVYGCLGFFQAVCQGHSSVWRYVADSSYWVYLIHIPLVPALETSIWNWPVAWWIKFPLLLVVSFFLLYLSYHYLVRSTFIGRVLNGRAYPFHLNPLRALRGG